MNQTEFIITKPDHSQETLDEHDDQVKKIEIRYNRTNNAMEAKTVVLERLAKGRDDVAGTADAQIELAKLDNAMKEAEDAMDKGTPITAEGDEKKAYDAAWNNYTHRMSDLALHRGKVNALTMRKCQPSVMDRLNTDPTWDQVVANADHLELMQLIRATVMSQTGDQYPFLRIQRKRLTAQRLTV